MDKSKDLNIETLLQKAEKLKAEIDCDIEMPKIDRNLKQLFEIGKDFWSRTNYIHSRDSCDIRASVLLGSKGYDLQKVSQHLESLNTGKKFSVLETAKDGNDLQSFLKSERENAFLTVIENVKATTFETINKNYWSFMEQEWLDYKNKILNPFKGPDGEIDEIDFSILSNKDFETKLTIVNDTVQTSLKSEDSKNIEFIINKIAVDQEKTDFEEDVDKLYKMQEFHNKAVLLLNSHLSGIVSEKKIPNTKRERMEFFALKLAEKFCTCGHNANKETAEIMFLLLDLMTFFDYYHSQAYNDALDTIQRLNVIPFSSSEIKLKVEQFGQFSEEIRRNIPDVLIASMNILTAQYQEAKTSLPQFENKFGIFADSNNGEKLCNEIKSKADVLITYAGMIPYRMSGCQTSKLVQSDLLMN